MNEFVAGQSTIHKLRCIKDRATTEELNPQAERLLKYVFLLLLLSLATGAGYIAHTVTKKRRACRPMRCQY